MIPIFNTFLIFFVPILVVHNHLSELKKKENHKTLFFSGQRFAMLEAKLLLAKVLLKYAIEPTWPLEKLKITFEVVLKARGGLRTHIRRRRGLNAPICFH